MDDVVQNTIDSHGGKQRLIEAINQQRGPKKLVDGDDIKRWLKNGHFPKYLYRQTNGILPTEVPPIPPKKYSDDFELLWSIRPKREGSDPKHAAYLNYQQYIQNTEYRHEDILDGVQRYANYCAVEYPEGRRKYIKQLQTFLSVAEDDEPHFMKPWKVEKKLSKQGAALKKLQDKYRQAR